jgi:hypothetical protein
MSQDVVFIDCTPPERNGDARKRHSVPAAVAEPAGAEARPAKRSRTAFIDLTGEDVVALGCDAAGRAHASRAAPQASSAAPESAAGGVSCGAALGVRGRRTEQHDIIDLTGDELTAELKDYI